MQDDDDKINPYASPVCYAHELDATYRDMAAIDFDTRRDVMRWRKAERQRLCRLRDTLSDERRASEERGIASALWRLIEQERPAVISAYWPIRGEPDLRQWLGEVHEAGFCIGLPVVIGADEPLVFRRWRPAMRMSRGRLGIAEPALDDRVEPDLVLAPLLGVDARHYRLGNGGGFYDRTLAAATVPPLAVGVGFEIARIDTIYPLPHDIPMQVVLTGA